MAQETIETIRQTELAAEKNEKAAIIEAEAIVAKAHGEAKELINSFTSEARKNAASALKKAGIQGEKMMSEAVSQVKSEMTKLQEDVSAKDAQAVKLILSELI